MIESNTKLFNDYSWQEKNGAIVIQSSDQNPLLAHTETTGTLSAQGEIEPLVGREWKVPNQAGGSVTFSGIYWTPGSEIKIGQAFKVKEFGIWEPQTSQSLPVD